MKKVLIEDDDGQWWLFEIPVDQGGHMIFYPAGYTGPYFAIQEYMTGSGWEEEPACCMGPAFQRCVNGVLKTPHLLFGLAGDEGGVKGKRLTLKEGMEMV